ncbi:MAG: hypothetical protein ACNFW9_00240 [Candidatus Kerfeldbacteria bacterium]|jgi:hypothetical protein
MNNNQKGVNLVSVIISIIVIGVIIGGGFLLLNNERSKTRDAKRLSDITRIQAAFEFLYNDTASYELAAITGCDVVGSTVDTCNLKQYMPSIVNMKDPGKFSYVVNVVPDEETYTIVFRLENSYNNYASGAHTLTPVGIR